MLNDELETLYSKTFKEIGEKIAQKRKKKRRKVQGISKKLNINVDFLDLIEKGNFLKTPCDYRFYDNHMYIVSRNIWIH